MVVTETTQLVKFVEQYLICQETNCQGKLKVNSIELAGIGGAASLFFAVLTVVASMSNLKPHLRGRMVMLLFLGFYKLLQFVLEHLMSYIRKCFTTCLECIQSATVFFGTLKEMYEHVKDILDGICLEARKETQDMDQKKLGSWQRAVTCGIAVWLTRGSFCRNCTYTV
uniref:Uncharacterized protein n=1 Tax=Amphimedon queenslandica TaxID=400682 RepID=A0A1X7UJS4_AMPQE